MTEDGAPSAMAEGVAPLSCRLIKEYGVVHLKGALSDAEQLALMRAIAGDVVTRPATNPIPANFHISSGELGGSTRKQPMHELGVLLYRRFADEVGKQLTPEDWETEHALQRLAKVHSGEQPAQVDQVTGVSYLTHSVLDNHQDGPFPLFTMSVAIGHACDFVVGQKPAVKAGRKWSNLRCGAPVTLLMESGDAIFFDGGSVPHAVPRVHKSNAPAWYQKAARTGFPARISVLFREPYGPSAAATRKNMVGVPS